MEGLSYRVLLALVAIVIVSGVVCIPLAIITGEWRWLIISAIAGSMIYGLLSK